MKLTPLQKYKQDLRTACAQANVSDWFERYINHTRGAGNTDALIYTCQQRGCTLIVPTADVAEAIHDRLNVKTTNVLNAAFATAPTRSVVDNGAILMLVREARQLAVLAEQLLTLMERKGID